MKTIPVPSNSHQHVYCSCTKCEMQRELYYDEVKTLGAVEERKWIVAWLRDEVDMCPSGRNAGPWEKAADAIERGEHLGFGEAGKGER